MGEIQTIIMMSQTAIQIHLCCLVDDIYRIQGNRLRNKELYNIYAISVF